MRSPSVRDTRAWLRALGFFGSNPNGDVEDEIRFHLEMRARELVERGMALDEARREAAARFGDVERVRAECRRLERARSRREGRRRWLADARLDLRIAARVLTRNPLFAVTIVLSLGLGIGANAAIFSAVSALWLRPMPVRDPDRMVTIGQTLRDNPLQGNVDYTSLLKVAERTDIFDGVIGFSMEGVALRDGNTRSREAVSIVTGDYFTMLGLQPQVGRLIAEHDSRERAPVVVVSDELWERQYGRDSAVVGRAIHLNGTPVTIIGVAPAGFLGTHPLVRTNLFVPTELLGALHLSSCRIEERGCWGVSVLARLRPDVPLAQARAVLRDVAAEIDRAAPAEQRGIAFPMQWESRSRPEPAVARNTPWILGIFLGLASLALLVACANVANLLLARAIHRQGEIAVRRAIGATPGRVARQLIAESSLLSFLSLGFAVVVALIVVRRLNTMDLAVDLPLDFGLTLDWRVFVYSALLTIGVAVLAGLAPAAFGRRLPLREALGESGARLGSGGTRRAAARAALVAGQVAVSVVLLVSAALFTRSVRAAADADLGFRMDSILMVTTDVTALGLSAEARRDFQERVRARASRLPGVVSAGYGDHLPFKGNLNSSVVMPVNVASDAATSEGEVYRARVSPGYLTTLGLRLVSGRDILESDRGGSRRVAVINRATADLLWPGRDPVGERFRYSNATAETSVDDSLMVEVIGVIETAKYLFVNEPPRPFLYEPIAQRGANATIFVLRTRVPPLTLAGSLRTMLSELHPEVVPYGFREMRTFLNLGIAFFFLRLAAVMASAIGVLSLIQTVVGLYGVLTYLVSQRRAEFGIRMALGARPGQLVGGVLRQGSRFVLVGLVIGLVLALALSRTMGAFLVGVSPTDLVAFGGASVVLMASATIAAWIPARRATGVSPSSALRGGGGER